MAMTNCQSARKMSIIKLRGKMKKFKGQRFNIWIIGDPEGDTGGSGVEAITMELIEDYLALKKRCGYAFSA